MYSLLVILYTLRLYILYIPLFFSWGFLRGKALFPFLVAEGVNPPPKMAFSEHPHPGTQGPPRTPPGLSSFCTMSEKCTCYTLFTPPEPPEPDPLQLCPVASGPPSHLAIYTQPPRLFAAPDLPPSLVRFPCRCLPRLKRPPGNRSRG